MDVVAIIISVFALFFSFLQYIYDRNHQRKLDTYIAFDALEKDAFSLISKELVCIAINKHPLKEIEWEDITNALSKIEHFSVGINTRIFDISIVNRFGGSHFIKEYELLKPIIDIKQKKSETPIYTELKEAIVKIEEHRRKKG